MADGSNLDANKPVKRLIVAPDSTIFSFVTVGNRLKPKSMICLYSPTTNNRPIYKAFQNGKCNYLDIEKSADVSMVPALYNYKRVLLARFTKDNLQSKEVYLNTNKRTYEDLPSNIRRTDTKLGKDGEWGLEYTFFEGELLKSANTMEYTLTRESFIALCQKYGLPMFGDLRDLSRLSLDTTKKRLSKGTTTISSGMYDDLDCVVKRVPVTTLGEYFRLLKIQRSCNEQDNMLRIYETRCDGAFHETAFERCTMDMDKYITENINEGKLKTFLRSLARGVIHLHNNGIVHGAIRPQNVLVKTYDTIHDDVPKLTGMSKCRKLGSRELQPMLFNWDIYSIGRTILAAYTSGAHAIADNDDVDERGYKFRLQLKSDMDKLFNMNPLVHNLVSRCLTCSISAEAIFRHFCFWQDGTYLVLMQRASDAMRFGGDLIIKHELVNVEFSVVGHGWGSAFNAQWLTNRGGVGRSGIDKIGTFAYDERRITHLVKLVRNVSHHLDDPDTKLLWPTPISFEKFILHTFPGLLPAVYYAVQVSQNPIFQEYL